MSASGTMLGNKLEDDVAAVLGMREDAFQGQPNLFLVAHAYFRGDKPRILSAVAASSGLIILMALFVGFLSFSPFHPTPGNHLKIDLPSDLFTRPYEKAFSAALLPERSRAVHRSRSGAVVSQATHQGNGAVAQQAMKTIAASEPQNLVHGAAQSQSRFDRSRHEIPHIASADANGGSSSPERDTEQPASQGQLVAPDHSATASAQLNPEAPNVISKALYNRRSAIDALRALRHQ